MIIDPDSSTNILYWEALKGMNMNTSEFLPFKGTLDGFFGEQVQVLSHVPMMTIFGSGRNSKSIKVRYLIMNASSPYNIIRRPVFNALEAVLSTLYLTMKYPLEGGYVGTVKGDQGLARKCYKDSLKLNKKTLQEHPIMENTLKVTLVDLDHLIELNPRGDLTNDSLNPI